MVGKQIVSNSLMTSHIKISGSYFKVFFSSLNFFFLFQETSPALGTSTWKPARPEVAEPEIRLSNRMWPCPWTMKFSSKCSVVRFLCFSKFYSSIQETDLFELLLELSFQDKKKSKENKVGIWTRETCKQKTWKPACLVSKIWKLLPSIPGY